MPFIKKYQPDILCLQETKAERHQSEVDLAEYEEYWNSASRKGYSGTAIFLHKTLGKPIAVMPDISEEIVKEFRLEDDAYGDPNAEGRVVTLELKNFFIVSVYTPNAKDDLSRLTLRHKKWDPAFLKYMKKLAARGKPVIFCGDLNVAHTEKDLARPKENKGKKGFTDQEREGIEKIISAGFVDTFRIFTKDAGHYTWWSHFANARSRNIGWRIDYIFASENLLKKIKGAEILPEIMGSDHCPVLLEIL